MLPAGSSVNSVTIFPHKSHIGLITVLITVGCTENKEYWLEERNV